ncbi:hypothetical protein JTE90_005316 [Oedothorax gibbosus]|uniref:DUF4219 domain-containing protein n=1 Tax=Oedothorax gibbosus TaxID=931172 RepID=A0AAV6UHR5_9ARAC|nr:hypothetical protein JTE90_005316 [Oedothorax gibbosus]
MEVSQIEKLDASNYGAWKEDVRVLLMERNCWRITSGEEKYPTEVEPDEKSTPAERSKDLREKAKEIKDFSIRRDKAYSNQKQVPSSNKSVTIKPVTKTDEHHPRGRKSRPKGRQPQSKGRRTPSFSRQRDKPPHQTSYVIHALLTEGQADKGSWIFDTAASSHLCCQKDLLEDYEELRGTTLTVAIAGVTCQEKGMFTNSNRQLKIERQTLDANSKGSFDAKCLKNYKSLAAYEYVISGKVQQVYVYCPDSPLQKFRILGADVQPSQRIRNEVLKTWVIATNEGTVQMAHCTCMAGFGETCSSSAL